MNGKIALVTGGSRGLGKNMASSLAEKGSDVILTYNSREEEAVAVVKEIEGKGRRAATLQLNVGETKSFDDFIERVSRILRDKWGRDTFDFLINNAGVEGNGLVADTSEETFDFLCNIHFKGAFFLTQKTLPLIAKNGRVINLRQNRRVSLHGRSALDHRSANRSLGRVFL